jgi:hypothetical protein
MHTDQITPGETRAHHEDYGNGTVKQIDGNWLLILFDGYGCLSPGIHIEDVKPVTDPARYLADSTTTGVRWWLYRFPNGRSASVIPALHHPFRFEIQVDDDQPITGLTTEQVEAKLTALANN